MAIQANDLPHIDYTNHELIVLKAAADGVDVPCQPDTLQFLIGGNLLHSSSSADRLILTSIGQEVVRVYGSRIRRLMDVLNLWSESSYEEKGESIG